MTPEKNSADNAVHLREHVDFQAHTHIHEHVECKTCDWRDASWLSELLAMTAIAAAAIELNRGVCIFM